MPAEDLIKLPTISDANTAPCVNMNFQIEFRNNLMKDLRNFFSADLRFLGHLKKSRNYNLSLALCASVHHFRILDKDIMLFTCLVFLYIYIYISMKWQ